MQLSLAFPGCHKRAGVERIMLECANHLASRGHDVTVYASEFELESLVSEVKTKIVGGPRHHIAIAAGWFDRAVTSQLRNSDNSLLCSFGVVSPPGGVHWVQSVHKAWIETSQRTRSTAGRLKQLCNPIHPLILRREHNHFVNRRYRKVIALTERVKYDLQRFYNVPDEDIVILPNGFSGNEFNTANTTSARSEMRAQLGYLDTDKVVIFVANELDRKGFFPLTRAIAKLNDKDLKLLVVGSVDSSSLSSYLSSQNLLGRTKFIGPTAQVWRYYAAADVFALPTIYEAWGMVIVEAMACGIPVVTSKLAGAAIAVQDGLNGFLLDDPSDPDEIAGKLSRALNELKSRGSAISQSVTAFEWKRILTRYEEIVLECAQTSVSLLPKIEAPVR